MQIKCEDRERIFLDGSAEDWARLELHATSCAECAKEVRAWKALSVAAGELRDYQENPALWPRIEKALALQAEQTVSRKSWFERLAFWRGVPVVWQTAMAGALALMMTVTAGYLYVNRHPGTGPVDAYNPLLKDSKVAEVERAEREYMKAIDKLACRGQASTGCAHYSADGQLPGKTAHAGQRHRRVAQPSRPESLECAFAISAVSDVPGKTGHVAGGIGDETMKPALSSVGRKSIAAFAVVLVVLALPAFAEGHAQDTATRNFEKTLTLGANQTFAMEHKFGDVHIHGENGREVRISATIRTQASTQAEADKNADQIKIEVTQDAQGIKVRTVYPDENKWSIRVGKGPSYSVDYDIAVPGDAKIWLRNNFGNVEIRSVHGWAEVENGHGKLEVRDSGASKLTNSFGAVEVNGVDGNLTVVNNNGEVTVSTVKGSVDLKDRFAAITVSNVQGPVTVSGGNGAVEITDAGTSTVSNSFGSVNMRNIHGDLTVNNNNGAIDANMVSGSATMNGSFGAITFTNVNGHVKCTSSNGKVKGGPVGEDVYVKTSFGEVQLDQVGGSIEVDDSNGGINVKDVKGHATLNTSFGSIEATGIRKGARATTGNGRISLSDIGGDTFAKTSFGAVNVQRVSGTLTLENSNGPVTANSVSGDTSARTSFGPVTLDDIGGSITVDNQNGAVMLSAARQSSTCKNITVKTSFSPIQVKLPEGAGYNLTARTSFGRINSELPVTSSGQLGGDSLNGKIGNGGCTLSLTNSNGSIDILKLSK